MNIKPKGKTTEQKIAELKEAATDPLFLEDLNEIEKDFQYVDAQKFEQKEQPWWISQAGIFKDDPLFDKMVEEGQKYRKAQIEKEK